MRSLFSSGFVESVSSASSRPSVKALLIKKGEQPRAVIRSPFSVFSPESFPPVEVCPIGAGFWQRALSLQRSVPMRSFCLRDSLPGWSLPLRRRWMRSLSHRSTGRVFCFLVQLKVYHVISAVSIGIGLATACNSMGHLWRAGGRSAWGAEPAVPASCRAFGMATSSGRRAFPGCWRSPPAPSGGRAGTCAATWSPPTVAPGLPSLSATAPAPLSPRHACRRS